MEVMTFEQRIKTAREAAGLSQVDVEFQSRIELPEPLWITQAMLSRLERGSIGEDKADPLDVCFLAHLYNVTTLRAVQELMGHADPATTAGYAALDVEAAAEVVEALPILGRHAPPRDLVP